MTKPNSLSLPLVASAEPSTWQGFAPLAAPEPVQPQGAYGHDSPESESELPEVGTPEIRDEVELLAPAGESEAGFAAFHFGADAIYLGLKKFSARAEAENFTFEQVDEITAYAHSLEPRRRVFVTINTLIRQDELAELIEAIALLNDIGVDALIVQDLGVYHLVRQHFPQLELHASTQLSVHNHAGARTLRAMGFGRVVLARELTFEEVRDITSTTGIETEVFIHGALCYSYSGLCLFSAQTLGRSGNRGKCVYSCRDSYEIQGAPDTLRDGSPVHRDPSQGFPFSMKDLALPDHLPALRAAGVSCFKIEGRKKSPLYVATTTDYYRKLIDGTLSSNDRPVQEADMQTVFSRPWTKLFVQSHTDKEVADRDTVGHRGTLIGQAEAVTRGPNPRLRFRTSRRLERHDGLQIDIPGLGKPFGFAVDGLWCLHSTRQRKTIQEEVMSVEANHLIEVSLPAEHPELPLGSPVYCSSSQAVKQHYRHRSPKPKYYHSHKPLHLDARLDSDRLEVKAKVESLEVRHTLLGPFDRARNATTMEQTARTTFGKLQASRFELASLTWHNEMGLFVPSSKLNQLRRELVADLEAKLDTQLHDRITSVQTDLAPPTEAPPKTKAFRWSIKVDRIGFLDALEESDLTDLDEIVLDITRDHPTLLQQGLAHWQSRVGDRVRLALPALTRSWEERGLRHKIDQLRQSGYRKWEAANLSAWHYLDLDPASANTGELDLATDWSIYVINRLAAEELRRLGVSRFTLSPEDGLENVRSLLSEYANEAVLIVHQDTPLFLAESCAYANLIGGCPGKANCRFESMEMEAASGEKVTALDYHCRTIVLNQGPFCLSPRLPDLAKAGAIRLRADFVYRPYTAEEVRERWRRIRSGRAIPGGHSANFDRGMQ